MKSNNQTVANNGAPMLLTELKNPPLLSGIKSYDKFFNWDKIKNSKKECLILVNVNRIYWKYAILLQKEIDSKYLILEKVIQSIEDEKIRYIPMTAKDILDCFSDDGPNLPKCTFVEYDLKCNT